MLFPFLAEAESLLQSLQDTVQEIGLQFGVTWPLFLSNVISFLLVCYVLWRFAYGPVLKVLEARRDQIAESLKNVEKIKLELAQTQEQRLQVLEAANGEAQKTIAEARAHADLLAKTRQGQASAEAAALVAQARDAARLEYERMLAELRGEVARLVVATTAKVSGKVLSAEDQQRLSEEAAREIAS